MRLGLGDPGWDAVVGAVGRAGACTGGRGDDGGEASLRIRGHPARHASGHDHGVTWLDRQWLTVQFDGCAAIQHGPHLLGVEQVRWACLAGAHVNAP